MSIKQFKAEKKSKFFPPKPILMLCSSQKNSRDFTEEELMKAQKDFDAKNEEVQSNISLSFENFIKSITKFKSLKEDNWNTSKKKKHIKCQSMDINEDACKLLKTNTKEKNETKDKEKVNQREKGVIDRNNEKIESPKVIKEHVVVNNFFSPLHKKIKPKKEVLRQLTKENKKDDDIKLNKSKDYDSNKDIIIDTKNKA